MPIASNAATIAAKAPLASPAFTGTPTVNGSAIGTGGSATVATAAKGATFVVRKDPTTGFWPTAYATDGTPSYTAGSASTGERYTARDDVTIIWKGAPPFPPTVVSPSTAGVRDNVDFKFEEPV